MGALFDNETGQRKPTTSGTGLFGGSEDFLTTERNKISQMHTRDWQDRDNPFRMLGGAMKTYNLQNSPEVQQMRDTETIMQQIDITNQMEVGVAYKELMKIGNVRGAVELLQQHKSLAPDAAAATAGEVTPYMVDGKQIGTKQPDKTGKMIYNEYPTEDSAAPKTKTLYVNGKPVVAQHREKSDVWTTTGFPLT